MSCRRLHNASQSALRGVGFASSATTAAPSLAGLSLNASISHVPAARPSHPRCPTGANPDDPKVNPDDPDGSTEKDSPLPTCEAKALVLSRDELVGWELVYDGEDPTVATPAQAQREYSVAYSRLYDHHELVIKRTDDDRYAVYGQWLITEQDYLRRRMVMQNAQVAQREQRKAIELKEKQIADKQTVIYMQQGMIEALRQQIAEMRQQIAAVEIAAMRARIEDRAANHSGGGCEDDVCPSPPLLDDEEEEEEEEEDETSSEEKALVDDRGQGPCISLDPSRPTRLTSPQLSALGMCFVDDPWQGQTGVAASERFERHLFLVKCEMATMEEGVCLVYLASAISCDDAGFFPEGEEYAQRWRAYILSQHALRERERKEEEEMDEVEQF